jgi:hypothetical protein
MLYLSQNIKIKSFLPHFTRIYCKRNFNGKMKDLNREGERMRMSKK